MGGIAILARQHGYQVSGSDANVYPPMSTQLAEQGIELMEGYHPDHLQPAPDCVVVGNALTRGNPAVEYMLDKGLPYTSGPQWLFDHLLADRWVLAAAGTHGKTTTASMLAWILEYAGMTPGFLIGGIADNFGISARSGEAPFFVVEADEYDSAFFDKRSKFIHYHPRTLIINNMEFDHADIFRDIGDIQRQFHHLVRTVPGSGLIITPCNEPHLEQTLEMGCWTPVERLGFDRGNVTWRIDPIQADGSRFRVWCDNQDQGVVAWSMTGDHNMMNAVAAIAAARHAGVIASQAVAGLCEFQGVKRRLEIKGNPGGITVYDDFAHHPTAIEKTLAGLRAKFPRQKIIAVFEPRSNTMRMGVHNDELAPSFRHADDVIWYQAPNLGWDLTGIAHGDQPIRIINSVQAIIDDLVGHAGHGDQIVIMSNGGFDGIHTRLLQSLTEKHGTES